MSGASIITALALAVFGAMLIAYAVWLVADTVATRRADSMRGRLDAAMWRRQTERFPGLAETMDRIIGQECAARGIKPKRTKNKRRENG